MKLAISSRRKGECGQTIAIVALSLVSLLGLAALAIDVSALYVARDEAQRAADAAALAGARVFAASSYVTVPNSFSVATQVCGTGAGSPAAVNKRAVAAANENSVSNRPATVTNITCDLTKDGNPQLTVVVKQTNVAGFLSRIWNQTNVSVSATATAEAYNASGQTVPVQVTGVKPWLFPNCDPLGTGTASLTCPNRASGPGRAPYFVDPITGDIANSGGFIGRTPAFQPHRLMSNASLTGGVSSFYSLDMGSSSSVCPSGASVSCNLGANNYEDAIACSRQVTLSCGQFVGVGTSIPLINSNGTKQGTRCLIHAGTDGLNRGQDEITFPTGKAPVLINGGTNNPVSSLRGVDNISRSDSIVTVPLYDTARDATTQSVKIVGFLQLAITQTLTGGGGGFEAYAVNAVGCGALTGAGVAGGGGASPISVRLINPLP